MSERPAFSVIMPVCHAGSLLRDAVAAARELDAGSEGLEVLVAGPADDAASRRSVEEQAAGGGVEVRYVPCDSANRSAKLNAAWRQARGRVLAFVDDDCAPPRGWLRELGQALGGAGDVGVVGGPDRPSREGGAFDLALEWVLNSLVARGGFRSGAHSGLGKYYPRLWNMAMRAEVAGEVALGGDDARPPQLFDEALGVHEDVDLVRRIEATGRRIEFAPDAWVKHARAATFRSLVGRNYEMGRVSRRLGVHRLVHGVLAASLVGAAAIALLAGLNQTARLLLVIGAGAYAGLVLGCAATAAVSTRRAAVAPYVALILVSMHVARGLGFLFPKGRDRVAESAASRAGSSGPGPD